MLGPPMIDALVLSLSNIVICLVAAALYVAVNELEPNRIVAVAVAAILGHLTRYPALVLATPGS